MNFKIARFYRCLLYAPLALAILASVSCGGESVETVAVRRGEIQESFSEPARTRLQNTYRIVMPVAGRIDRINLEPGDKVAAGQILAQYDLTGFDLAVAEAQGLVNQLEAEIRVNQDNRLEATALLDTQVTVDATSETLKAANAQVEAQRARAERALKELERQEELARNETISESDLDDAKLEAETAVIGLRQQEFTHSALLTLYRAIQLGPRFVREYISQKEMKREGLVEQLNQAKTKLAQAEHDRSLAQVVSPIEGVVLERYDQGDSPLPAGQPLLLVGNPAQLEAISDILTQDALRLRVGSRVILTPATGIAPIQGSIKRIEPAGFTKLSSLGVEQQRVNAIIALEGPSGNLGVGYRLQARFITGEKSAALIVPRPSVLQDSDQTFYVMKEEDGKVRRQPVQLGLRSDLELEIIEGLNEGDAIVAAPSSS